MSTLQKFYNPEPPSNKWPNIILFICAAILFVWIFFCLTSCNSVKKSTDININKVDSSSKVKIDSTVQEKKDISVDSSTLKTWDKETTIEFEKPEISKSDDTATYTFPINGYEDGLTKVKGRIKSITIREKSKDSTNLKKSDNLQKETNWTKNVQTDLSKKDKSKETNKESKRSSPVIWIVLGAVIVASIVIYAAYKKTDV